MSFFRRAFGSGLRKHDPASLLRGRGAMILPPEQRLDRLFPRPTRADRMPVEWARELVGPGEVVWDIGAEAGVFGLAAAVMAGATGAVLALEADARRAARLRKMAENLGAPDSRYDVYEAAVVDWSSDNEEPATGTRHAVEVTLDSLLKKFRSPTVLKISERVLDSRILGGAKKILTDRQPVLLLDVHPRYMAGLGPRLRGLGYELFDASVNPNDRIKLIDPPRHTLAVPKFASRE